MAIGYVLYNRLAGNADARAGVEKLKDQLNGELRFSDVSEISDYRTFLGGLDREDYLVLAGGDGTLNCFINNTDGIDFENDVLYYPNGTGNDFAADLGYERECRPFSMKSYIRDLPIVTVNGKRHRFLNGVGYGIDGYCCEEGDRLKQIPGKKVDYTRIAIKGLLKYYKPTDAKVTVDGRTFTYCKTWLAPTMNGRRYGGGMIPTPAQTRNSGVLSTMVFHDSGKLKTLMIFPSIFKGKHVSHTDAVQILTGKQITVEFDRPVALQIDGETIRNVRCYTATAGQGERLADA